MLALRIALAAILVLGLSMANAQQSRKVETTQDLYEAFKNAASPIDQTICVSYISGVGDTMIGVRCCLRTKAKSRASSVRNLRQAQPRRDGTSLRQLGAG
jgi:hypothetical protein